ncbi:elongator complex protein 1 [Topomyia yanbarensis]|uniref:elongator complex protein 1 n=1 Tax=Topomyia yanbarensis TaxID=2498891 RepID=UPI00273C494A|nr:elongator complex protein 1 [Topomyia yanbarensis]
MKNLYRLCHQSTSFRELPTLKTSHSLLALDPNNSDVFYIVTPDDQDEYSLYRLDRTKTASKCDARLLLSIPGQVIGLDYLALTDELCLATAAGEVMVIRVDGSADGGDPDEVTFCAGGLEAMGWSTDQGVVVFVDCNLNVVTMNSVYDPINEVCLKDDTFGDREFMSVGWGKKETQFHGSEGKVAARKKKEEAEVIVDVEKIDPTVRISWRADGELFVVGFLGPFGRAFKVFNKEGALQFTSEKCFGLGSPLAWKPSGLWIAVPQVLKDKYVIALFEKNGLKHREIELPFKSDDEVVVGLHWSHDSEVLIIHTIKSASKVNCLYFLIICNYHWYIKQYLEFDKQIVSVLWDLKYSEGRTLHVLLENGDHEASRWDFSVDHSRGVDKTDESLVAVIDGDNLLLTNFRSVVVPPPMCGFTVKTGRQINATGFLRNFDDAWDSNCFFVVDYSNKVSFYRPDFVGGAVKRLNAVQLVTDMEVGPGIMSHWMWLRNDLLLAIEGSNDLKIYSIASIEGKLILLESIKVGQQGDRVVAIEGICRNSALIELRTGQTYRLSLDSAVTLNEDLKLPEFCEQIRVHPVSNRILKIYSLRNRQNLYVNGSKIASDVTSMFLAERFLLFTTIAELKFLDLQNDSVIGSRRVERGSKLIIVVPKSSRTVFQLPRGNLEAIAPRVLSLCLVADHLNALEYHKAFDILRKERINLNLIVDHNPQLFLSNLERFLEEITNVNWLNLFITDLLNQDVCQTMYDSNYRSQEAPGVINGYKPEIKIEYLCDRLLHVLNSRTDYTLPKITCFVRRGLLEQALQVIWELRKTRQQEEAAEEALKYLLYLVDVNDLFNVALGMYDFGLVLYVATKSQKDPKEYLQFLNELKRLEEHYRKYRIDCHLKRFGKALENIARCGDDDDKFHEALQLTITHGLYTKAMAVYKGNEKYYKRVCVCYGDHLRQSNKQADASLIYEKAGDFQQAIASARNAVDWARCLRLAKMANQDESDTRRLVQTLIPALQETAEYEAASYLAKDYLKDSKLAVDILLKDHLFGKAMLEAQLADESLIETRICPELDQYLQDLGQKLSNEKEEFLKHKNRLLIVREQKAKKKVEQDHDEDDDRDVDDCDLYSDTSTIASSKYTSSSGRSGKSHRSSKNRRKHARKLLNLKEGNPFEDIALIDALHAQVLRICGMDRQQHIRSICKVAIEWDRFEQASEIQRNYQALFDLIKFSLDSIWIPEMVVPGSGQDVEVTAALTGDLSHVQNVQHYAMIKPHQRFKPVLQSISWQFEVLK